MGRGISRALCVVRSFVFCLCAISVRGGACCVLELSDKMFDVQVSAAFRDALDAFVGGGEEFFRRLQA